MLPEKGMGGNKTKILDTCKYIHIYNKRGNTYDSYSSHFCNMVVVVFISSSIHFKLSLPSSGHDSIWS